MRQARPLGGGERGFDALREAPRLGERGGLGGLGNAVPAEIVGENDF